MFRVLHPPRSQMLHRRPCDPPGFPSAGAVWRSDRRQAPLLASGVLWWTWGLGIDSNSNNYSSSNKNSTIIVIRVIPY